MSATVVTLWAVSLVLGAVVIVVAAILLGLVLGTARQIDAGAKQIWIAGKLVARNTVHIPDLRHTNQVVADILETAGGILMAAQRILSHAQRCPGCPACLAGARR